MKGSSHVPRNRANRRPHPASIQERISRHLEPDSLYSCRSDRCQYFLLLLFSTYARVRQMFAALYSAVGLDLGLAAEPHHLEPHALPRHGSRAGRPKGNAEHRFGNFRGSPAIGKAPRDNPPPKRKITSASSHWQFG